MTIRKGSKLLVFIAVFFAALPPFATDTYIPAFGKIGEYFNIPPSMVATSVSTYFLGFALGMLFWGALSDRVGRKKTLILGMFLYMLSSTLCSLSHSYEMLLYMRFIQGLGDSSGAIVAMAIVRDCYRGKKLITTMATLTMVFMLAPIASPMIGSFIIYSTGTWQDIFHFLTIYGIFLFILAFFLPETLKENRKTSSIFHSIKIYVKHLSNVPFLLCSVIAGLAFSALFSFISSSSVLIIDYFKLGYFMYCILFALNIVGIIFVNYYIKKKITLYNQYKFIFVGYGIAIISLIINLIIAQHYKNIYLFVLINTIATSGFSLINVISTSKALNQLKEGYGSGNAVSSLIKFSLAGFASFMISSYTSSKLMTEVPTQQIIFILIALIIFLIVKRKLR